MRSEPTIALIGADGSVGQALSSSLVARVPDRVRLFNSTPGAVAGRAYEAMPGSASDLAGVSTLVHLADIVHAADDGLYQAVNVDLPAAVARMARDAGVARVVFLSSLSVNGHWSGEPYTPDRPLAPMSPYGASKAKAESALRECLEGSQTRLTILRPPLAYGPGLRTKFNAFVRAARIGAPLPIGLADARRSMVSLTNLTDAIIHLCKHDGGGNAPLVLLPADDRDLMVRETYATLCSLAGKRAWQPPVPMWAMHGAMRLLGREGMYDSLFRPAIIDRAHWRDIGWSPPESVEDGLRRAIV